MRKLLNYCLILSCLIFASCKKSEREEESKKDQKTYKLHLSVSQQNSGFSTLDASGPAGLRNLVKQLTIVIYTGNEEFIRKTQLATDSTFGVLDIDLPPANYTIVVIGSKSTFGINQFYRDQNTEDVYLPFNTANFQYLQGDSLPGERHYKTDDTFFAKKTLTFEQSGNMNVVLQRIVGQLELTVEDCNDYWAIFDNEASAYTFGTEASFAGIQVDYWARVNDGTKTYRGYFLRTDKPLHLEIRSGSTTKEVTVPIYKNRVTVLKGKLFAPPTIPAFNVSINDKWSTDTAKVKL